MEPTSQAITVSQFLAILNETLTFAFPTVTVEGEVSSFKVNQNKWIFFDLKDKDATLGCFMPRFSLKLPLEDGMKVRVTGTPKLTNWGKFSFTVKTVELAGEGELKRAFELLRKRLASEGLFEPARKRPLPAFPRRLGLITSGTSAAYSDFIKILNARWSGVEVLLADVQVQGAAAPDQIVGALEYFNHLATPADVLVLIRGGGSLEDLQAFSTEPVARAVAASRTPIIVGVGHEIDVSLADYAADVRAATPTDAARLVVPDRTELLARVSHLERRATSGMATVLDGQRLQIDRIINRLEAYLRHPRERLATYTSLLWRGLDRLEYSRRQTTQRTVVLEQRLTSASDRQLGEQARRLIALARVLKGFDPQFTLERGYAIVRQGHTILRDPEQAPEGSQLVVQLAKGKLNAEVRRPS